MGLSVQGLTPRRDKSRYVSNVCLGCPRSSTERIQKYNGGGVFQVFSFFFVKGTWRLGR